LLAFHDDPDVQEGATIVHADRGASALYFLDAAGNVAELIANDHLDNGCDRPFGADSFLDVAEIGVATAGAPQPHELTLPEGPYRFRAVAEPAD
jgi:hypothetical protein